jgi:hypothetical protein
MPTVLKSTVIGAAIARLRMVDLPISTAFLVLFLVVVTFLSLASSVFPILKPGIRNRLPASTARVPHVRAGEIPPSVVTVARTNPPTGPVTPQHWLRVSARPRGSIVK